MNNYIRPLSHYLNNNNYKINKNILTENKILLQQSPKLSSRKFRVFNTEANNKNKTNKTIKNCLFSLNDINDKITNKRGTDIPDSFKRYDYEELKKIITSSNVNKIKEKENLNNNNKEKNEENKNNINEEIKNNEIKINFKRPNSAKNLNKKNLNIQIENNSKENKKENKNEINNNKKINKNIIANSNKKAEELLMKYMINKKSDKYLPKNYNYYNTCLNNPILYNEIKNEQILSIAPKYKILNYNKIKNKINESDIFNLKTDDDKKINKTDCRINNKYMKSNIFNTNPLTNYEIEKSGEKYLFNNNNNFEKYSKISDSKSDFIPYIINNTNQINSNNLSNVKYNIIAPNIKNYLDLVKNDIQSNKKIKGLSEFYDKTRKTNCNNNIDYQKAYKNNKFTFRKVHQMCGDYIESYNKSKSLVNHPFKNE